MDNVRSFKLIPEAKLVDSALEAAQGAEALIIATEWHEFTKVDLNQLKEVMASPLVFDGRNLLDPTYDAPPGLHVPQHRAAQRRKKLNFPIRPGLHPATKSFPNRFPGR